MHSGKPKRLYFEENKARFAPWLHKIRHLVINLDHRTTGWGREKEHRRRLIDGFDGNPDDKILLSDLDEIPHPDAVRAGHFNLLLCRMHVGKLNWRWQKPATVHHSIARTFPAAYLMDGGNLEEARLQHFVPIGPEGWHLSWMHDPALKLSAFAEQELVPLARPDLAAQGKPLFPGTDADHGIEWVGLDKLPPYVAANAERFRHLMVPAPI